MSNPNPILGNLTSEQFLTDYWQKKPLLIKQAIPNYKGILDANELAGLACEEDVQSRIVQINDNQWQVKDGPFKDKDFAKLPANDWTLLVQSVNHFLPEAAELLKLFNFIPNARLDDLMISYAPKGGGVGPHLDSYDVFLLQGSGKRNWKISTQTDHTLIEGAPLKILKHFVAEQEWVLEAGDMLYLPPQVAHWGIAEDDDCMTYSIGFRAPKSQELLHEFMNYLQDTICVEGLYADPDLTLQQNPAEISHDMVSKVNKMLTLLSWNEDSVGDFLGRYLTEPKSHVFFEPNKKITLAKFTEQLATNSLSLSLQSQLLFWNAQFYLNGERLTVDASISAHLKTLANQRLISGQSCNKEQRTALAEALYPHYLAGYLIW
jgi:50S ribosomal protein L16 3-hydroxylase